MNSEKPTLEPTNDGKHSCKNILKLLGDINNLPNISSNIWTQNQDYNHNLCVKHTMRSSMRLYDGQEMCLAVGRNYPSGENFDWLQNSHCVEFEQNGLDSTA
jgi:hypothetical protein